MDGGGCVLRDVHAPAAYLSHEIVYDVAAEPPQGRRVLDWLTVVSVRFIYIYETYVYRRWC